MACNNCWKVLAARKYSVPGTQYQEVLSNGSRDPERGRVHLRDDKCNHDHWERSRYSGEAVKEKNLGAFFLSTVLDTFLVLC